MALPKLRRENGKLKLHVRSHVSGNRSNPGKHLASIDRLDREAKQLERKLRRKRRSNTVKS